MGGGALPQGEPPASAVPFPPPPEPGPPSLGEEEDGLTPTERAIANLQDYCPPVEVKIDGPAYIVYERGGEGEPSRIRYQATFSQFPRNCTDQAGTLTIRLGIAGLLISGPRGGPGSVTVPLRVQIVQDNDVIVLDRPLPTPITIPPGGVRGEFSLVQELVVPSPPRENMRIVIGFDQPR
jgi:hypothetical protein